MAGFEENPFAGDSENPFAVSIPSVNKIVFASQCKTNTHSDDGSDLGDFYVGSFNVSGILYIYRIHRLLQLRIMPPKDWKISIHLRTRTQLNQQEQRLFIFSKCFIFVKSAFVT